MHDLNQKSAQELLALIESREVSATESTEASLERLFEVEPSIAAFVTPSPELALAAARRVDDDGPLRGGPPSLAGLPLSVKDLIDVAGLETTFGSRAVVGNVARADAPSVEAARASGSCIVGKTTTTEFGCKAGGGDSPLTGVTRNPWNLKKSPGGSSAGAAASVAAGVTPIAIASDGGGSVRVPAALCGLVGLKPQFGRIPVHPPSAAPSLFHVGILARTVPDVALLLGVIGRYDRRDPATVVESDADYASACRSGINGMRIAWSPTLGYADPNAEVLSATVRTVERLELEGARVDTVELVFPDPIDIWHSEFFASASRKLSQYVDNSAELLDPAVLDALRTARHEHALDRYFDRHFARYELRETLRRLLTEYDVLATPTLPVSELNAGENTPPGFEHRSPISWAYYTYPFNLTGNPAISVPCGMGDTGMPIGIQFVARMHREVDLFRVAGLLEQMQPWRGLAPLRC